MASLFSRKPTSLRIVFAARARTARKVQASVRGNVTEKSLSQVESSTERASSRTEPFFRRSEGSRAQHKKTRQTKAPQTQNNAATCRAYRIDNLFRHRLSRRILEPYLRGTHASGTTTATYQFVPRRSLALARCLYEYQYRLPLSSIVLSGGIIC